MIEPADIRRIAVVLALSFGLQLVGDVAAHAAHETDARACVVCHVAKATAFPPAVAPATPPATVTTTVVARVDRPAHRPALGPARDRGPPAAATVGHAPIHAHAP
ncbi:MAG: hypothetical protein KIT14_12385 [bacterium]|nr:hypothetical protein [bacterium]